VRVLRILLATEIGGDPNWIPQGIKPEQIAKEASKRGGVECDGYDTPIKTIVHTAKHLEEEAEKADFWIFHCMDMDDEHNLLPDGKWGKLRKPWSIWVWFCEEKDPYQLSYLMNMTMTMRLESDIVMSYVNSDREMPDVLGEAWNEFGPTPMVPFEKRGSENPVLWMAHNCQELDNKNGASGNMLNNRTEYVRDLMEHVGVDSLGGCLNTKTDKKLSDRSQGLMVSMGREAKYFGNKYKFYLSFENSNCRGYVSEKLPKAFIWNLVPIVGGPDDWKRFIPTETSAISTEDFPTAQALGEFIKKVAANETLYNQYHSWRSNPNEITPEFRKNFPPQSTRDHDVCKFTDVWKWGKIGGKIAKPFEPCRLTQPGGI